MLYQCLSEAASSAEICPSLSVSLSVCLSSPPALCLTIFLSPSLPPRFRSRKELVSEKWWVIQCWYWRAEWWYSRPTDPPPAWIAVTAVQRASRQRCVREERWQRLSLSCSHARSLLIKCLLHCACKHTHMHNSVVPKPSELPIWLMYFYNVFFFFLCLYFYFCFNQSIS